MTDTLYAAYEQSADLFAEYPKTVEEVCWLGVPCDEVWRETAIINGQVNVALFTDGVMTISSLPDFHAPWFDVSELPEVIEGLHNLYAAYLDDLIAVEEA